MAHGSETYDIHAPIVISDAGLINTYQKLIPKHIICNFGQFNLSPLLHNNNLVNYENTIYFVRIF